MLEGIKTNTIPIEIYPTRIKVSNYELGNASNIEKYLSVWDKIYHKYSFKAFKYDKDKKEIYFPVAINMRNMIKALTNHGDIKITDLRDTTLFTKTYKPEFEFKFKPRDTLQKESINFLKQEMIDNNSQQRFLSLNTGEGKTFCSLRAMYELGHKPLIIVSNNKLKEQWIDRIKEYTTCDEDNIFIIQGKSKINKLNKMSKEDIDKYDYFIAMHQTLKSVDIKDLANKTNISIKLFDEAHLDMKSLVNIDLSLDLPSFYLSATPSRSDQSENIVFSNIFMNTPKFSSKGFNNSTLVKNKNIVPEKYHNVVMLRLNTKPSEIDKANFMKASNKKGIDVNHYFNYILENDSKKKYYYDRIFEVISNVIMSKEVKKTMVMFKRTAMIDEFYDYLIDKGGHEMIEFLDCIRYYNGSPKEEKDKLDKSNLILTTDISMGVGIDINGLEAIINTVPLSSESKVTQIMGRLRYIENKKVVYYDIIDSGFTKLTTQANKRFNVVYKKKAISIKDFKLN